MTIASSHCYPYLMGASFYSLEYRQATLDKVLAALEADERVIGVLVVGSGAVGFDDHLSDTDLCIVAAGDDAESVFRDRRHCFEDWNRRWKATLLS